ncbi:MAG: hypothetical protein HYZ20_19675 [Burkholderiales bacterium]|nr:hypothetical protein [Burkholderiales bacterium]
MADEPIGDRARQAQRRAQVLIDTLAKAAFERMWRLLMANPGMSPRQAILAVQVEFGGGVAQALAQAFGILLDRSVGAALVRALPVGEITLAQRLYRHSQAVAAEVTAIVREHAKGVTQARELARRLYDGYNVDDGIRRPLEGAVRAELPKALRKLTEDPRARRELTALMTNGQQQAARLRTTALRAAYLEAFERWEQGGGQDALKRLLWVAQHEKNRYVAERIARTELHRAHQAEVAREFMGEDELEVVQVLLNPRHPVPDICDMHARADLFGLGRGCYPKAKAPRPPFHPFCRCVLRSRPDLDLTDARPQPMAAQAFIRGLPAAEAARIVGSKARLHQVLAGADPVAVWDAGVKAQYRTQRLGDGAAGGALAHPDALPGFDRAVIPTAKLRDYVLNPDHPEGGHKARVIAAVLGFDRSTRAQLEAEILRALPASPAVERGRKPFGREYTVDVPVTGPAGSGIVRTGWMILEGENHPRLVSAYVRRKRNDL